MININEEALKEIDWLLQESYKRAVKLHGITDWSEHPTVDGVNETAREVERYQLQIAKMIQDSLHETRHLLERQKFDKRMEEQDKKWEKREIVSLIKKYETGDKGYTSYDKDNIDKRDTDDIGK